MNEYLTPGTETVIKYSDILSDIQHQLLEIFIVCGVYLFIYTLFNIYVRNSDKFNSKTSDTIADLPEQIKGFMDSIAVMFALLVTLASFVARFNINL